MIIENHPCDPDTNERFSLTSRITVKDYGKKIFDVCCLYKLFKIQKAFVGRVKKYLLDNICTCCKAEKPKWPKPKSMEKLPDSDSGSEDAGDTNIRNELTICS